MVQLTRIYTKGGDKGKTSLGDGSRVYKSDQRIHAIGEVDAVNADLGVASLYITSDNVELITHIQHDLFDLGADLCQPRHKEGLKITDDQITWLEKHIDAFNEKLSPLKSFVLPGGTKGAAFLHVARTRTRTAERACIPLMTEGAEGERTVQYLNRLSDFLFVLARIENDCGAKDVLWQPGKNQTGNTP